MENGNVELQKEIEEHLKAVAKRKLCKAINARNRGNQMNQGRNNRRSG